MRLLHSAYDRGFFPVLQILVSEQIAHLTPGHLMNRYVSPNQDHNFPTVQEMGDPGKEKPQLIAK